MKGARAELPKAIYTAEQVRRLDRIAIDEFGISGYELMCRAGEAALGALRSRWPDAQRLAILCGAGNNAGDGYVLARLAHERGLEVRAVAVVPTDGLGGDAKRAWQDYQDQGGKVESFSPDCTLSEDVVVDGLLGTGLARELEGDLLAAVQLINTAGRPVLALDIPTGLHADTGLVLGAAVSAELTITFVGLKRGLFLGSALDYRGRLEFSDLAIPVQAYDRVPVCIERLTPEIAKGLLLPRTRTAHKGENGSLLLVGGAPGMSGAIRLAAEAAFRAGAGLVRVATHPDSVDSVMAGRAEVMCQGTTTPEALEKLLVDSDAVVLGPGLGQSDWAKRASAQVLESELPVILDADGLNLLSETRQTRDNWILTPHPGEAARLLRTDTESVQADRLGAAVRLAGTYGGVAVLKGAGTLVTTGVDSISLCDRGNPGMATAGMGDVLAGLLGGLAVQGGDLQSVAQAGVLIHAACGDAAAASGERGLLAGDLMAHIRKWVNLH
jgi:NAD(P)H-hydrate epimerase